MLGAGTADAGHPGVPYGERHPATAHVSQGRSPEASRMPRPMMVLAGERQLGQQVSPIREQNFARGLTGP